MDIGGQAVIEGVMMRNKEKFAVAVRLPDKSVKIKKDKSTKFPKYFKAPFIRGVIGLGYTLYDGLRALIWSSNQQLEKEERITKKEAIGTIIISLLFAALIFVVVPFFSASFIHSEGVWFNVLDGVFRIGLFVGYLGIISLMKDVKTLFRYHGAEHKTISCYEKGQELTIENARQCSRFHPRCGTSFIFVVLLLSIVMFSFINGSWVIKFCGRLLLLPAIAGIGYELIKLSGKYKDNSLVKFFIMPGLWLQKITTKEPTDDQLEIGIRSLEEVLK